MANEKMTVAELAAAMGKDYYFVRDELRRDSRRDVKHWPFATSKESDSGRWSHIINRNQFEKWWAGDAATGGIDLDRLADRIIDRMIERGIVA